MIDSEVFVRTVHSNVPWYPIHRLATVNFFFKFRSSFTECGDIDSYRLRWIPNGLFSVKINYVDCNHSGDIVVFFRAIVFVWLTQASNNKVQAWRELHWILQLFGNWAYGCYSCFCICTFLTVHRCNEAGKRKVSHPIYWHYFRKYKHSVVLAISIRPSACWSPSLPEWRFCRTQTNISMTS